MTRGQASSGGGVVLIYADVQEDARKPASFGQLDLELELTGELRRSGGQSRGRIEEDSMFRGRGRARKGQ